MSSYRFGLYMAHLALWGRSVAATIGRFEDGLDVDRDELECALAIASDETSDGERRLRARLAQLEAVQA